MTDPAILPLAAASNAAVDALLDRVFGPDRHERTAYRVRAGTAPILPLCFAACTTDGALVGTIQAWPVALALDGGGSVPMVMVGPVAVEPDRQGTGIGVALMKALGDAAPACGDAGGDALMLIGDPEYYGRFGFTGAHTAGWRLPGPVERHRLLARGPAVPTGAGLLGPRLRRAA